jgi:PEP-CTERM motif-containing protein
MATSSQTQFSLIGLSTTGGDYIGLDNVNVTAGTVSPVPEPGTYELLLTGIGVLGCVVRRRGRIQVLDLLPRSRLPGEAARGWGPGLKKLAKKNNAAQMIGVVRGERDELIAHGHGAGGSVGAGWASDEMVEAGGVLGGGGGLLGAVEEAVAELFPRLFPRLGVGFLGEAVGGIIGVWSFFAGDPLEGGLLPEGEMPELFVDGVGDGGEFAMGEVLGEALEDVGG